MKQKENNAARLRILAAILVAALYVLSGTAHGIRIVQPGAADNLATRSHFSPDMRH
ncbi:MAG TPA: hypothetical protein VLT16_10405 [Candidatus Limnocylindrales bacterium]|nr:hypothetical protein [Candidatus Limnocylindrales bacterium]